MKVHHMFKGIAAMVAACTIWGLSPLYFRALSHVAPVEILSHRIVWSAVFFTGLLMAQGRLTPMVTALKDRMVLLRLVAASLAISVNWLTFIWTIGQGNALGSSLGYYVFPLVSVLFGWLFFAERLSRLQGIAVALAAIAVVILTYGLGVPPWVALILSVSFGTYGVIKKGLALGPVLSVTAEVLLVLPFALAWLTWRGTVWPGGDTDTLTLMLLVLSGPLTGLPLILFSYAARRVRLSTVGLVQYLNPTLQFLCAVLVFGNPVTLYHATAFGLIWVGLALYSASSIRQDHLRRRTIASTVA